MTMFMSHFCTILMISFLCQFRNWPLNPSFAIKSGFPLLSLPISPFTAFSGASLVRVAANFVSAQFLGNLDSATNPRRVLRRVFTQGRMLAAPAAVQPSACLAAAYVALLAGS
jgi:hypothetical protein